MAELKLKNIKSELKKHNRFVVEFIDTKIEPWVVSYIQRPKYDVQKSKWSDILIELCEPIGPSSAPMVFDGIVNNFNHRNKDSIIFIKMLDPVGQTVETWILTGKYINIEFSELNYSSDDFSKIKINFKVNKCEIK